MQKLIIATIGTVAGICLVIFFFVAATSNAYTITDGTFSYTKNGDSTIYESEKRQSIKDFCLSANRMIETNENQCDENKIGKRIENQCDNYLLSLGTLIGVPYTGNYWKLKGSVTNENRLYC